MFLSYALLLDGGFLRYKLGTRSAPVDAEKISAFISGVKALPCVSSMHLHRIYFYDAKPLEGICRNPLNGEAKDFSTSPMAARNNCTQAALAFNPFMAMRFGELSHQGWALKKRALRKRGTAIQIEARDIEPSVVQKGVDMRIGLDIASLTLKQHVKVIVLVTGDSDFIPAMKFARREGAQLFLLTLGHGVKAGMREHADLVIDRVPINPTVAVRSSAA